MRDKLQILEVKKKAEFVEFCEINEQFNCKLGELAYLEQIKKNIEECAEAFRQLASISKVSVKDLNKNLAKINYDFSSHCRAKAFQLRNSLKKAKSLEFEIRLALKLISEELWLRKQKLNQLENLVLEEKIQNKRKENSLQEMQIEELISAKEAA